MEKVCCRCVITGVAWHFVSFYITIRCKIHSRRVRMARRWESYFDINDTRWFVNLRPKSPSPVQSRVALRSSNFFPVTSVFARLTRILTRVKQNQQLSRDCFLSRGCFPRAFYARRRLCTGNWQTKTHARGAYNRVIRCRSNAPPFQNNGFRDARALWNIKIQRYSCIDYTLNFPHVQSVFLQFSKFRKSRPRWADFFRRGAVLRIFTRIWILLLSPFRGRFRKDRKNRSTWEVRDDSRYPILWSRLLGLGRDTVAPGLRGIVC